MDIFGNMINKFLSDFINGFVSNVKDSTFMLPDNIFSMSGVADKFDVTQKLSGTFSVISLVVCLICILFSLDVTSTAKLRQKLNEFMFSIFIIYFGQFFINYFNKLSNLFVQLWMPNVKGEGITGAVLASIGVAGATGVLETLGFFLLCLLGLLAVILLLLMLTHSIVIVLLQVLIVVFPIVMAVFPLNFGKKIVGGVTALYGVFLGIAPLQVLVLNLFVSSIQTATSPNFTNICNTIGSLIVAALIIPGALILVITKASTPKVS